MIDGQHRIMYDLTRRHLIGDLLLSGRRVRDIASLLFPIPTDVRWDA